MLGKEQQSTIKGGVSFICYFGLVGGPWKQLTFKVEADNLNDALWGTAHVCNGRGATCSSYYIDD